MFIFECQPDLWGLSLGILGTQGATFPFSQLLGSSFSLHFLSSVEAKIFENRRWAEDGSQLPGTLYLTPSFCEVSYPGFHVLGTGTS